MSTVAQSHVESKLQDITVELTTLASQCPRQISTPAELEAGTAWLAALRTRRKAVEEWFAGLIRPLQAAVKQHQQQRDQLLAPLAERESRLNGQLLAYRAEQQRQAAEKQAKALAAYERKVERAEAKGHDTSLIAPPPVAEAPEKTLATSAGAVTFRTVRKWRIKGAPTITQDTAKELDLHADDPRLAGLPLSLFSLDLKRCADAAKAGLVPQFETYEEEVTSVRRG